MSEHPFGHPNASRSGGKPLFILGGVLLAVGAGCMVGMTLLLMNAGNNADPNGEGLIPGQSNVFVPVAVLIGVGLIGFMGSVFAFMIGAKRMSRSARV